MGAQRPYTNVYEISLNTLLLHVQKSPSHDILWLPEQQKSTSRGDIYNPFCVNLNPVQNFLRSFKRGNIHNFTI